MEKEATTMIDKDSANVVSGILVGSSIGIGIWAILIFVIYSYLL